MYFKIIVQMRQKNKMRTRKDDQLSKYLNKPRRVLEH